MYYDAGMKSVCDGGNVRVL
jgi:HEPN superfamily RiboL-PSP-like protein